MENKPQKKTKKFLRLPTYPGGRDAYRKFVSVNLVYPALALEHRIQGTVYLSYIVNNMGLVSEVKVLKGIGYGCDEEAQRVIRLLQYRKVNNRGILLKSEIKTGIRFILPPPPTEIRYSLTDPSGSTQNDKESPYSYTITIQT